MNRHSDQGGAAGFTLLELLITTVIATIFLMMAVPSFIAMLQENRLNTAADQLYVSLAHARSEAVKRRGNVRVCPADTTCLRDDTPACTCRNDGDWSDGWITFDSSDGSTSPSSNGVIIKAVPYTSLHGSVTYGPDTDVDDFVEFGAMGGTIDSTTNGTFNVCYTGLNRHWRQIDISASGRIEDTTFISACGVTG